MVRLPTWWLRVLFAQGFCLCPLRGLVWQGNSFRSRINAVYARHQWSRRRSPLRRAGLVLAGLLWPVHAVASAAFMTSQYGPHIRRTGGPGLLRQFLTQCRLAFVSVVPPPSYYQFEMHRPEHRACATEFVHQHEMLAVLRQINGQVDAVLMNDKVRAAAHFHQHGLPTLQDIAVVKDGHVQFNAGDEDPQCDIFIKPTNMTGGRGAQRWNHSGDGQYVSNAASEPAGWNELVSHVRTLSRTSPYLVQPCVIKHPKHEPYSKIGLCTTRVMTRRSSNGDIEVFLGAFKMPTGDTAVDNFSKGSLVSPIDVRSGTLGPAVRKSPTLPRVDAHPDTNAPITGETLAHWDAIADLAIRAHQTVPDNEIVGWDIALAPDGPLLVEGNLWPCFMLLQRTYSEPFGARFLDGYCRDLLQRR